MCGICSSFRPYSEDCDYQQFAATTITEGVDAAAGTSTIYSMSPGDTFLGNLGSAGDSDWVAIQLVAGQTYNLDVKGSPSGVGTLADPITSIHDSAGNQLATNDDGGAGYESHLSFTATYSGTYYVVGRGFSTSTGTYQLTMAEASLAERGSSGTIDTMAAYLTDGYWYDTGSSPHQFRTISSNQITVNLTGLTADGQKLARWAFEAWESVANLEFVETTGSADITLDDNSDGATANATWSGGYTKSATVNIGTGWLGSGTQIGSYSFQTYMHEIGHALGLGHLGDYNGGAVYGSDNTFIEDSWQMSVMSYFDQDENTEISASKANTVTPMIVDVLAIQELYGAAGAGSLTDGDTVYGVGHTLGDSWLGQMYSAINGTGDTSVFDFEAITFTFWDRGGYDVIDFSNETAAQAVDLRAEAISSVGGKSNNMLIARGTVIEEFRAGSGNDMVQGNSADNVLKGNAGNDSLFGDAGDDTLQGGTGADTLDGGTGTDAADYSNATVSNRVDLLNNARNSGDALGDVLISIENLFGGTYRDVFFGDGQVNELRGSGGRDLLNGRNGSDRLLGEGGSDKLVGGGGRDILRGGNGSDRLFGGSGNDKLYGDAGNDILDGGSGNDILTGGSKVDTFIYNAGADIITDFDGDLLQIDAALWGGASRTAAEVLGFAGVIGGDTVFDFGGGDSLTLRGFTDVASLESVLTII